MTKGVKTLEVLNEEVKAQWAKFDEAVAAGMTGAPLVMIDQKLARLERERDAELQKLSL